MQSVLAGGAGGGSSFHHAIRHAEQVRLHLRVSLLHVPKQLHARDVAHPRRDLWAGSTELLTLRPESLFMNHAGWNYAFMNCNTFWRCFDVWGACWMVFCNATTLRRKLPGEERTQAPFAARRASVTCMSSSSRAYLSRNSVKYVLEQGTLAHNSRWGETRSPN